MDRRRLGKYDVLCRISTGGMSQIFLAAQQGVGGFNKLVVLKMILPDIVGEEDFVRMFLDEARISAAFNHPHIAQVFELDTADDALFMAMEFVQGCTLVEMARACRQAKEPIPVGFTLAAVRDTALALHYAHTFVDPRGRRQVVIHRDVAEKNIMVTYEGVSKLLDFGIAKALGRTGRTSVGMVKGTSGYMSPEQIRGEPLDPRSDIFSLGVVLHECLTGLRLFHGKNAEEGMLAALKGEVAPPSKWNPLVSAEVDAVVLKALKKDREARFGTALELARAIERAAPGAIWHPEESGELVMRHFAERRAETRRVLEVAMGPESSSEIRVESIIARMRAGAERPPGEPVLPPTAPSVASVPASPIPAGTQPGIVPHSLPGADTLPPGRPAPPGGPATPARGASLTTPARGRVVKAAPYASSSSPIPRAPSPAAAPVRTINLTPPAESHDDDDDSYAKTIPAAALPQQIRELRRSAGRPSSPPAENTEEVTAATRPPVARPSTPTRAPMRAPVGQTESLTPHDDAQNREVTVVAAEPTDDNLPRVVVAASTRPRPYEPMRAAAPPPDSAHRTYLVAGLVVVIAALVATLVALALLPASSG
jgi:serine/threonine protein kinase